MTGLRRLTLQLSGEGDNRLSRGLEALDSCGNICTVKVETSSVSICQQPETIISARELVNLNNGRVRQEITVLGCSEDQVGALLYFLSANAEILGALGLEAFCCVCDEFQPPTQTRSRPKNFTTDCVVAVEKIHEKHFECSFDFLKLTHCLPDSLPNDFAIVFAECVELLTHSSCLPQLSEVQHCDDSDVPSTVQKVTQDA